MRHQSGAFASTRRDLIDEQLPAFSYSAQRHIRDWAIRRKHARDSPSCWVRFCKHRCGGIKK
jgi:hypothetical protein